MAESKSTCRGEASRQIMPRLIKFHFYKPTIDPKLDKGLNVYALILNRGIETYRNPVT